MSEQRLEPGPHLEVLHAVGMLSWVRCVASGLRDERSTLLAAALLGPVRDAAPSMVPDAVAALLPPSSGPGELQVGAWNDLVGALVTAADRSDRVAFLAGAAVLQLGLGMSEAPQDRAHCQDNLSYVLLLLHGARPDRDALAEAERLARSALAAASPGRVGRVRRLVDVLCACHALDRDGAVLVDAIELARTAIGELPAANDDRIDLTNNLAGLLKYRYSTTGDSESLREAKDLLRSLVAELPSHHPAYARSLHNLAHVLGAGPRPEDPDDLLDLHRSALARTQLGDPLRLLVLAELTSWLSERAKRTGSDGDLDEALAIARRAVVETPPGQQVPGVALRSLSKALSIRYELSDDDSALDEAVAILERGAAEPRDEIDLANMRFDLAVLLNNRYVDTRAPTDARRAVTAFQQAARSPGSSLTWQAEAADYAAKLLAELGEWAVAAESCSSALDLLPTLTGPLLTGADREHRLTSLSWLPVNAASYAIAAGHPERALEYLERGRGILYSADAAVRDGLGGLARQAPEMAAALGRLASELEAARDSDDRHRLAREQRDLADQIREVPGFEDFLRPLVIDQILDACRSGPVILPVLSIHGGDALIATASGVRHVPLPDLTVDGLRRHSRGLHGGIYAIVHPHSTDDERGHGEHSVTDALSWLWDAITGSVLDELGITGSPPEGARPPRIWWCPTGFLSYLPLHAAGRRDGPCALDRATSSYTATMGAPRRTRSWRLRPDTEVLVVAMPHTPGMTDLPAAELEAEFVAGRFPRCRVLRGPAATREHVMRALQDVDIAHFACHTGHDPDRYEGRLLLHDGALALSDITRVRADRGGLAFLSACATARPRPDLPDESLSIATGFHLAGFSHVIASLWPIADRTALHVVTDFYTELLADPDPGAGAAHALYLAVDRVRERERECPSLWASYIHIGA